MSQVVTNRAVLSQEDLDAEWGLAEWLCYVENGEHMTRRQVAACFKVKIDLIESIELGAFAKLRADARAMEVLASFLQGE